MEEKKVEIVQEDWREDFEVHKIQFYSGPNYYLNKKAMVFNIYIKEDGLFSDFYKDAICKVYPELEKDFPDKVVDLFVKVMIKVLKLDMDLFIDRFSIMTDNDEYTVAVEYLDKYTNEDVVFFVRDWFRAISEGKEFNFEKGFKEIQDDFLRTLYGGPTLYSLIEAGLKRNIPVNYLYEENQKSFG